MDWLKLTWTHPHLAGMLCHLFFLNAFWWFIWWKGQYYCAGLSRSGSLFQWMIRWSKEEKIRRFYVDCLERPCVQHITLYEFSSQRCWYVEENCYTTSLQNTILPLTTHLYNLYIKCNLLFFYSSKIYLSHFTYEKKTWQLIKNSLFFFDNLYFITLL